MSKVTLDSETEKKMLIGIYGRMQIELIEIGLLYENGAPKPKRERKHRGQVYEDALKIYEELSYDMRGYTSSELDKHAQFTNDAVKKLVNRTAIVNNYTLSLMQYRDYLTDVAPKHKQLMMLPKVYRLIDHFIEHIGDADIVRHTHRVADNLWRQFTGRAQLPDELRDILRRKWLSPLAEEKLKGAKNDN